MKFKSTIKTLTIIHASMCLTLIVFASFVFFQNGDFSSTSDFGNIFVYIVPVIAMAGYFGSKLIYKNLTTNLQNEESLTKKLQRYQIATIFKFTLIEAPSFIALFIYYIDGNALYLVIGLSLMFYLIFERPTLEKLKNELPLNLDEKRELDM